MLIFFMAVSLTDYENGRSFQLALGRSSDPLNVKNGILQGKVSIGPLCPVEPCNLSPQQIAEVYGPRKVIVYDQLTKNKVAKVDLDQDGEYALSLTPGKYVIDVTDGKGNELPLEGPRVRFGNVQPKEIEIRGGEKTEVFFNIDSGIR